MKLADHLGREVEIKKYPQRIISLCPSITETICALGLAQRLVGRTRFCIHPEEVVKKVERVGGTKSVSIDRINKLEPELIIAEKEENTKEMVEALEKEFPVFVTEVQNFDSAFRMISDIGLISGQEDTALSMILDIQKQWDHLIRLERQIKVLYLIWKDPWMAVGEHTFINDVLTRCNFDNIAVKLAGRYPIVDMSVEKTDHPEWIFLSSEPYPFSEKHIDEVAGLFPSSRIKLVDGEMFSWYGSRMKEAAGYLLALLEEIRGKSQ